MDSNIEALLVALISILSIMFIVFLAVAIIVFIKLRKILGRMIEVSDTAKTITSVLRTKALSGGAIGVVFTAVKLLRTYKKHKRLKS